MVTQINARKTLAFLFKPCPIFTFENIPAIKTFLKKAAKIAEGIHHNLPPSPTAGGKPRRKGLFL